MFYLCFLFNICIWYEIGFFVIMYEIILKWVLRWKCICICMVFMLKVVIVIGCCGIGVNWCIYYNNKFVR